MGRAQKTAEGWFVSPAILARADQTISEVIHRMVDEAVGSTLILSDGGGDEIEGIFTERDLLKNALLLRRGDFWDKPIRTVMSKPVRTIELSELHRAAEVMLTYSIRHLPVVRTSAETQSRDLVGVVSMRDLFRAENERLQGKRLPALAQTLVEGGAQGRLAVIEPGSGMQELLHKAFEKVQDSIRWEVHTPQAALGNQNLKNNLPQMAAAIVDVDGTSELVWAKLLKDIHGASTRPPIFVIYDALKHEASARQTLEKLATSSRFYVFQRPLNLSQLMLRLAPCLLPAANQPIR
ncbi:MAG: CBS domain-containing protein [Bdellovibrionales bacterium]|nr:CBS domain-containing protein [Bdellovibrionales bacterium]